MTTQQMTDERTRELARQRAREIGDEEWRNGNTKYALEAWEASDITVVELFDKARKLLEAETLVRERIELRERTDKSHTHGGLSAQLYADCHGCKTVIAIDENYLGKIISLLGWKLKPENISAQQPNFYRSAAVACLKLIKRI